jgi:hypothetical protein
MTTTTKIDTKSSQLSVNNQSSKFNHSYNENNEDDLFGVETIQSNTITSEAEAQIQNLLTSFTTKQKNLSISKPNMTASVMAESFSSTNMFHNAMNSQKHNHFMESSEIR